MGNSGSCIKIAGSGGYLELAPWTSAIARFRRFSVVLAGCFLVHAVRAQQPAEPVNPSPLNGETYYLVDQISGLQADLNAGSTADGANLVQNSTSFTSLTQRWALTLAPSGNWKISNISNGLCMDSQISTPVATVQQPCAISQPTQEWIFTYVTNGYYTVQNASTGLLLDIAGSSTTAGSQLVQTAQASSPTQSQLWIFRPAFFRGDDNALLAKQEADRLADPTAFFNDAGQVQDDLLILKNHGVNMIRLRPTPLVVPGTTTPLYNTYTVGSSPSVPATCTGNGCSAETDAADLAIAKRAKELGMSLELTVFYDGGSSTAAPAAWNGYTSSQVSSAIYTYVKAQIEEYRAAGVMPDIVTIGNEVNTGFLGTGLASSASGSPAGAYNSAAFTNFATYQKQGMQAVLDAASDTTLGPAIPPPLRCIHTTPAWLINSFYPEATQAGIPYDMVCESYYPVYHGPLTSAQASSCTSTTSSEPEQTNLANGITAVGKPILLIEIGERYETGFGSNDCFYPVSRAGQRQFTLDIQSTMKALNNNLGAGMVWWDATGTNVPIPGSYANYNAAGVTADLFYWDGFTLFDDADNGSYVDNFTAPTYSTVLPALTALGGKLDTTLAYKFVNASDGRILETAAALTTSGASLDTGLNIEITSKNQEWQITSNGNGYFQIANLNPASPANVLDTTGLTTAGSPVVQVSAAANTASQEWDVVTAGNGYYTFVNDSSGLVLATAPSGSGGNDVIQQQSPTSANVDWITPASTNQMWQIIPVNIVTASTPAVLGFAPVPVGSINSGGNPGTVTVEIENTAGVLIGSPSQSVTLTITGPGSFSQTENATSSNGLVSFNLANVVLTTAGTYSISVTSPGLTSALASLIVGGSSVTATTTLLTAPATSVLGASLTLTATVTGASGKPQATGMVTFLDGTKALGSGTLNSAGVATYTNSALGVGSHSITASYAGDTNNAASVSSAVSITVTPVQTTTALISSASTVVVGTSLTFTATVTGTSTAPTPTGTVTFSDSGTMLGIGSLSPVGVATYTTSAFGVGSHSITASYAGDASNSSSTSNAVPVTVNAAPDFSISLSPTSATTTSGGSATSTITVTPVSGFNLLTSFACSGLPSFTSCAFSPVSLTPNGAAATSVLTIATDVQTASSDWRTPLNGDHLPTKLELGGSSVLFAFLFWPTLIGRKRRGLGIRAIGVAFLAVVAIQGILGCGGAGSNGSSSPMTPSGQSTVTVTATAGTLSHSAAFQLTVQ